MNFLLITLLAFFLAQSGVKPADSKPALTTDGYSEKQLAALSAATLELRKLNDAVTFGLTLTRYREKMGEAKTVIDDAQAILPKGAVLDALKASWELHQEAVGWWDLMKRPTGLRFNAADIESLKKRHPNMKTDKLPWITREEMLTACWLEAKDRLDPLIKLTAQK
jgi:soluble cytochrome b562